MAPVRPYTLEEIDDGLTALIKSAGNANGAVRHLKAAGKRAPTPTMLRRWAQTMHWERYESLRETFAPQSEQMLANNLLDTARFANDTAMLAVEKARKRLNAGKDEDPGRTAANLARVAQSATDKRLSLQGRPTTVTEHRDPSVSLRALVQMGLLKLPDEPEPEQIEAGSE